MCDILLHKITSPICNCSSISSMLNSLSAVTWEDFLKLKFSKVTDEQATVVTKSLVLLFGCLGVGMAFAVKEMGGTVLQASFTLNGAAGAPLVGLFILGACFTSSNWIGAIVGGVLGFAFPMWCGIGKYIDDPQNFKLPLSTAGCNASAYNSSIHVLSNTTRTGLVELEGLQKLYGLSYIWFSVLGVLIVVVVGLITSWVTGPTKQVDAKLQLRFWEKLCICLFQPIGAIKKEKQRKQLLETIKNAPPLLLAIRKPSVNIVFENGNVIHTQNGDLSKQTFQQNKPDKSHEEELQNNKLAVNKNERENNGNQNGHATCTGETSSVQEEIKDTNIETHLEN